MEDKSSPGPSSLLLHTQTPLSTPGELLRNYANKISLRELFDNIMHGRDNFTSSLSLRRRRRRRWKQS